VLGAFLLFQVQPIMGRFVLPWFGGTATAWSACLLFFQIGLLAGYAYAHLLTRWLPPRWQGGADLALLVASLFLLPIIPADAWKPASPEAPLGRLLFVLVRSVGVPYFVIASTSPLLQLWRAWESGRSPYRLFALSNAAALLALVSYPVLVEPALGVRAQALAWSALYAAFVASRGWCAVRVMVAGGGDGTAPPVAEPAASGGDAVRLGFERLALWVVLPAAASALLIATTTQLGQEVASIPFLWVLPLALYLLSFVICFDHERWYDRRIFGPLLAVMVPLVIAVQVLGTRVSFLGELAVYGAALFAACMVCHGELVRIKPVPRRLTAFYLAVALGGAVGGVGATLVAPVVFRGLWEFPITLVACCLLACLAPAAGPVRRLPSLADLVRSFLIVIGVLALAAAPLARAGLTGVWRGGTYGLVAVVAAGVFTTTLILDWNRHRRTLAPMWYQYGLLAGVLAVTVGILLLMADFQRAAIYTERNFYGVLRVREGRERLLGSFRLLNHGLTQHGIQYADPAMRSRPTTYYGTESGVGLALRRHPRRLAAQGSTMPFRIGVVGLGVGTLAAYARGGDVVRFYELDPAVVRVAEGYFTYLADTPAAVEIVEGDARLRLEDELARGAAQRFDVLAVDAFLGDAVPVHLLTRECVAVYRAHLRAGGLLAVHVSNRLLDFRPVTDALALAFGLRAVEIRSSGSLADGTRDATWMILGEPENPIFDDAEVSQAVVATERARRGEGDHPPRLWTDDYSSLWPLLRSRSVTRP
jgi:hypothetical protein